MTDKELISIVDAKAKKLWNEINTGHEYSIIDSYNQFYGICMEIAEMVQEEPHCDERQFDELSKLQEGIGQIAKAVYEHKGKENSTVEKIREILIENSFDIMEIRCEISKKEESVSEKLEKEICNYFNNWYFDEEMDIMAKPNHYSARFDDIKAVARHFAEWQKKQMMKEVVEVDIVGISQSTLRGDFGLAELKGNYKEGDKVKLIIIKDEGSCALQPVREQS